jgi:hypothetical protein
VIFFETERYRQTGNSEMIEWRVYFLRATQTSTFQQHALIFHTTFQQHTRNRPQETGWHIYVGLQATLCM